MSEPLADPDAVARLYDRTAGAVYGVVLSIVRDPSHAEEITEQVYVEMGSLAGELDAAPVSTTARLIALAHRKAVERVRSVEGHGRHDLACCERSRCADGGDSTLHELKTSASDRRVRDAFAAMPDVQRRAIELAYFGGHSCPEVARLLGVPLDSVRGWMRDALIELRLASVSANSGPGDTMCS